MFETVNASRAEIQNRFRGGILLAPLLLKRPCRGKLQSFMETILEKHLKYLGVFALYLLAASNLFAENDDAESRPIPGQYIVVLKQGHEPSAVFNAHALNPHRVYSHALSGFVAAVPAARLSALKNDPRVAFVEQDLEVSALGQ